MGKSMRWGACIVLTLLMLFAAVAGPAWASEAQVFGPDDLGNLIRTLESLYAGQVSEEALVEGAVRGMTAALGDKYSVYMTPEEYAAFSQEIEGQYVGIGISFEMTQSGAKITSVFSGSPAAEAGLASGDTITAVDGVPVGNLSLDEVRSRIVGPEGTKVVLDVTSEDTRETRVVTLYRRVVNLTTVTYKALGDVAYIRIDAFYERTGSDFDVAVKDAINTGKKGLVLDLRDNGGGLVSEALRVAADILPAGPIVRVYDRSEGVMEYDAPGPGIGMPVVVLVNRNTASAAEIVAAAVQDSGQGILLGEKTYGKGSMQGFVPVGDGAIKLTVAHYVSPRNRTIDGIGLTPDYAMASLPGVNSPNFDYLDGSRTLALGDVGLDVLNLQQILISLGIGSIRNAKGGYDADTQQAVKDLQRQTGLSESGVFGQAELNSLRQLVQAKARSTGTEDTWVAKAVEILHSIVEH